MSVEIEARAYGPDITEEERQALRDRVYLYDTSIVLLKAVPIQTVFQIKLSTEKIYEITQNLESFSVVIDLTDAKPPSAEIREKLRERYSSMKKINHIAAFTGRNFMLNIAAKFVLSSYGIKSYSVHKTMEQALQEIHAKKQS